MREREFNEDEVSRRAIAPGWWGLDDGGRPVLGPYPSREALLVAMSDRGFGEEPAEEPLRPTRS